jgi:hypothetical protein
MDKIVKICDLLDQTNQWRLADEIFTKYASSDKDILKKRILIPSEIKKIAEDAYKQRLEDVRFGKEKDFEIARQLYQRNYLELEEILKIHIYTFENRYKHSKSKKMPSYWEYELYGGDEGRKWASDIIRIYLPKKWKAN